jgi:adenine modification enzyme
MKKYITNPTLFGKAEVIGFGTDEFYVKEMSRDLAYDMIIRNHYSHKGDSIAHNKINLGVYIENELLGVLQYGYAMNPASCSSVVEGTEINQYLELNRMWIDDKAGRNTESRAISYSFKYIKGKHPKIKWVQSFADERCGGLGIVYQAANFDYFGEHDSIFWELDGEVHHNSKFTNKNPKSNSKWKYYQANKHRASKSSLRQFRYIFFIDKRWKKKCLLNEKPYPKHYIEKPNDPIGAKSVGKN